MGRRRFGRLLLHGGLVLVGISILCGAVLFYVYLRVTGSTIVAFAYDKPKKVEHKVADNRSLPSRLVIPALNVDANILYLGLTKDGTMDTPDNITDVGWYKYGVLPGNTGSAVVAGHVDGVGGRPGVFSKLDTLRAGDRVSVTDTLGRVSSFVVRQAKTYNQDDVPAEVFASGSGARLNLITCAGTWDTAKHHFTQRIVVFTDRESAQ